VSLDMAQMHLPQLVRHRGVLDEHDHHSTTRHEILTLVLDDEEGPHEHEQPPRL
jgi:hypothetical protein